jgi:hypothetical protein
MLAEMANVASECLKSPTNESIWAPRLRRYVCRNTPEGLEAVADQDPVVVVSETSGHRPISPKFKLVFLTATGGTAFFVLLCLVLSMAAGKQPPPLMEKVIMGFFDCAKIGFGAIVGLLGGRALPGEHA